MQPPLFFLSYARSGWGSQPSQPSAEVRRFFRDLSTLVGEVVALPVGVEPGYMDAEMDGGELWSKEILEAVGTCRVFVALLSDPYFGSEWCGKEWHGFSQRTITRLNKTASEHETCMLPVLWTPVYAWPEFAEVGNIQRFTPREVEGRRISLSYESDGLFGMLQRGQESEYKCVMWDLAKRIGGPNGIYRSHQAEPLILDQTQVRNVFQEAS